MPVTDPRHILITGASRGLGAALALAYAAPGRHLALGGRNAERLASVARACTDRGAVCATARIDVTDAPAMADWIAAADAASPLDLVIANAGVSHGTAGSGADADDVIFAINVGGVLNTVKPAAHAMRERRRGQIAIIGSLAGLCGFAGVGAYCASKAAVHRYGQALRAELVPLGVGVTVVCPGFIRTDMTADAGFPMPFLMDADRAAAIIQRRLRKSPPLVAFPRPMALALRGLDLLPPRLVEGLVQKSVK
ncbi:MAG: short-chain dehydrogenase [Rhodospirillaceae bacterium]|nr:short-chain dehydrogenase [Rhodospirillaceae bacterium]